MGLALGIAGVLVLALGAAAWLASRKPRPQDALDREALHRRADALGRELDRQAQDPASNES